MTPYQAYCLYSAIKRHFSGDSYDFFKYDGKTRLKESSFDKRVDKPLFKKLSTHPDPKLFLVANFAHDPKTWIGPLIRDSSHQKIYLEWKSEISSISSWNPDILIDILWGDRGQHTVSGEYPKLFNRFVSGDISIIRLIILNKLLDFLKHWDHNFDDPFYEAMIYPVRRASSFIDLDREVICSIVKENQNVNKN